MVCVMVYPCVFCVAPSMDLFVLCVACLTVFVKCLVKQFAMCLGVVAILLLNVMDVFSVGGGALLDQGSYIPGNESFLYTHANALKAGRLVVP